MYRSTFSTSWMVSGPKTSLAISPKQYLFRAFLQPMYRSPLRRRSWSFDDLLGLVIGHTQLVQKLSVSFSLAPIRIHNYWDRTGFRSWTYSNQANGLLSVNLDDLSVIRSHGGPNRPSFRSSSQDGLPSLDGSSESQNRQKSGSTWPNLSSMIFAN